MRIIAGERRGHKIDGPRGGLTRPTSDFVRESLFNILGEDVEGRLVVDLFAGTGALGLEALSRGASRAIFVEQNRENVSLIHRNLATLRYEDRVRVLPSDAYRWAKSFARVDDEPMVVLIDPPYRDYLERSKRVNAMLSELVRKLPDGSTIAIESGQELDDSVLPDADLWDVRKYGGTRIALRTLGEDADESEASDDGTDDPEPDRADA